MKKRIISFITAICLTVAVLPFKNYIDLFKNSMTAEAYANIDEYPDFSLDMYVANLMTNPDKYLSYKYLSDYLDEISWSPNTVIFELLRDSKEFRFAVNAWELENLIVDPSKEISKSLDEEGYFEAIILNALNSTFQSKKFYSSYVSKAKSMTEAVYSNLELGSDTVYYIRNFKELKSSGLKDFGEAMKKSFEAVHPNIQLVWDSTDLVDDFFFVCDTAYEFVEKLVTYQLCYEMTDEMKSFVHALYTNCDGSMYPAMKLALSNIDTACNSYSLSIGEAFADTSFKVGAQTMSKIGTKLIKGCIAYFPVGKGLLLSEVITKKLVNVILSTDKIIEQYYKMERFYEFEILVRSTVKSQMKEYQSAPSEKNAKILFAAIDVFFKIYDTSCDYANDYAKLICEENIINKYFGDTNKYNQLINSISNLRSMAADAYNSFKNLYYLWYLEEEYPEIYETFRKQVNAPSVPKHINALGVEFEKKEIEIGLEDSFGLVYANVLPTDATNQLINYTISNPEIASYSFGSIRPYAVGTTVITATTIDGGYTDELIVNVVEGHGTDGTPPINPTQIVPVKVDDTFTTGGLKYKVTSDDEVELTGYTSEPVGALLISSTVGYGGKIFNVTSIDESAFRNCKRLTSITIPDSVITIKGRYVSAGYYGAFYGCSGLTSITIPDSVATIGVGAFSGCTSLTSVTIPDSVTTIERGAFSGCTSLTSVTIPDSVTTIEEYAFSGCTGLISITIPDSVTSIGERAFYHCTGFKKLIIADGSKEITRYMTSKLKDYIEDIVIPDSVTAIGEHAFDGCAGLTSIIIPDSVTTIGEFAFRDCTGLTSVTIPDSVTTIEEYAFSGCTGLTSITIPDSVTSIGGYAFKDCTSLTSITIPNSVTSIRERVFLGCASLTSVTIPDSVTTIGEYAFSGCTGLASVTIPNSVTTIEEYAFSNCTSLTSITIPGVITKGGYVFYHCTSLKKLIIADGSKEVTYYMTDQLKAYIEDIVIPSSVTTIGIYAFDGYTSLTSITIPDSVTTIKKFAFRDCTGLTSITIPNSVTTIEESAFSGCTGLTSITIPDSVTSIGGFSGCTGLTSITIPDSVTSIGGYAFSGCTGLTSVTIPDSVTTIGEYAFSDCTGLTEITIPENVTSIETYAFLDCKGLKKVTISNGVTSIGNCAFYRCSGLTSIVIPNSIKEIQGFAFHGCTGLTDVYYMGTESEWKEISISSSSNEYLTSATIHFNFTPPQGDVNMDGAFNVADVVLLQKWLLAVPNVKLANWKAADLCEDGRLDVFDLCLMKRMLVN